MKKRIILLPVFCIIIVISFLVLFNLYNYNKIPKEYRNKNISFINDNITWSSNIRQLKEILGPYNVSKNSFNNAKKYSFYIEYNTHKGKATFEAPNRFSNYISNVTYEFELDKESEKFYNEIKQKLKEEFKEDSSYLINNETDHLFEISSNKSVYGITYSLSMENQKLLLNIDLQY